MSSQLIVPLGETLSCAVHGKYTVLQVVTPSTLFSWPPQSASFTINETTCDPRITHAHSHRHAINVNPAKVIPLNPAQSDSVAFRSSVL